MAVAGDLDMATASVMARQLSELVEGGTDVIVDLSELGFIDSSGLRTLMTANQQSEEQGRTLTLRRPTRNVTRVLAITGLDQVFTIEP
jgi:anti-sigma B factor antagonist